MSEMTAKEKTLRRFAKVLEDRIERDETLLEIYQRKIRELEKQRCAHRAPQVGDDGTLYCPDCKSSL